VLDLQSDQQKIYLADDNILQVIFGPVVFELDVQAILNANLHFDAIVNFRRWKRLHIFNP
jgi:hypothetical protein